MKTWVEAEAYVKGYSDGRRLEVALVGERIGLLEWQLRLARRWTLGLALALVAVLGLMAFTKLMRVW